MQTVDSMKVGDRLVLGKYGVKNDMPQPIVWIKASQNCDFITERVVDYICFDAMENSNIYSNSSYIYSNIFQFINSEEEMWYTKSHQADSPPVHSRVVWGGKEYNSHFGFLYHFEDYEISSISDRSYTVGNDQIVSKIRLPSDQDIFGESKFPVFRKIGIRPKGTDDIVMNGVANIRFSPNSYIDFWLSNHTDSQYVCICNRSGGINDLAAHNSCGLRPVCTLKKETTVSINDNGRFQITPYTVEQNVCTERQILDLFDVTQ